MRLRQIKHRRVKSPISRHIRKRAFVTQNRYKEFLVLLNGAVEDVQDVLPVPIADGSALITSLFFSQNPLRSSSGGRRAIFISRHI